MHATGLQLITPDWPAAAQIKSAVTTRLGGVSLAPYDSLNLATHVGDDPEAVSENRRRLSQQLSLPSQPRWLQQVHGQVVVDDTYVTECEADGSYSRKAGVVCGVMTADCLPLLLCDRKGQEIAAVHAGWRGLAGGVVEAALERFNAAHEDILVWLGPAIGPQAFEVGDEVRQAFVEPLPACEQAFVSHGAGKWLADIYTLARLRLAYVGVEHVYGGGLCTYSDSERFFSYRRQGQCGRMATLIWREEEM